MSAHTPGPWTCSVAADGKGDYGILAKDDVLGYVVIAEVFHNIRERFESSTETKPNAQLIAAAPELLAALQAVLHDCENLDMVESNEPGRDAGPWLMATNAIAKATGGAA